MEATEGIIKEQTDMNFEQAVKIGKLEYKLEKAEARLERARGALKASERLCQIYFDIATESTNEEWVRARRDKKLESIADTGGEG